MIPSVNWFKFLLFSLKVSFVELITAPTLTKYAETISTAHRDKAREKLRSATDFMDWFSATSPELFNIHEKEIRKLIEEEQNTIDPHAKSQADVVVMEEDPSEVSNFCEEHGPSDKDIEKILHKHSASSVLEAFTTAFPETAVRLTPKGKKRKAEEVIEEDAIVPFQHTPPRVQEFELLSPKHPLFKTFVRNSVKWFMTKVYEKEKKYVCPNLVPLTARIIKKYYVSTCNLGKPKEAHCDTACAHFQIVPQAVDVWEKEMINRGGELVLFPICKTCMTLEKYISDPKILQKISLVTRVSQFANNYYTQLECKLCSLRQTIQSEDFYQYFYPVTMISLLSYLN